METFWPEADPDASRNNLNVAICGLRKTLARVNPSFSYVVFQSGEYLLNPLLKIWLDSEAFSAHVDKARALERRGEKDAALHEYRAAESLYHTELLVEDRYEDWLLDMRQHFQLAYVAVLERLASHYFDHGDYPACVTVCGKMLAIDACNEGSHRRFMRCYSRLGQPYLAVRQYHRCLKALADELEMTPSQETVSLFERLRRAQPL